jgi:hypothetical protein
MWRARSGNDGACVTRPADDEAFSGSGLFGPSAHRTFTRRITRPAADVIGVENTRATSLSWPEDVRGEFSAELGRLVSRRDSVGVTVTSSVTMAPVLAAVTDA